jgi:hypothetical protein
LIIVKGSREVEPRTSNTETALRGLEAHSDTQVCIWVFSFFGFAIELRNSECYTNNNIFGENIAAQYTTLMTDSGYN